jgi:hypothetical protein
MHFYEWSGGNIIIYVLVHSHLVLGDSSVESPNGMLTI